MIKNFLKLLTVFFILLNIVVLIGGYVVLNDVFKSKAAVKLETEFYLKKEEDLLNKLDIVKQSNEDVYANIKVLHEKTLSLQNQIGSYTKNVQSSQSENALLQSQLLSAKQQNAVLQSQINSVQNQIIQQNTVSAKKTVVKRTTRSS